MKLWDNGAPRRVGVLLGIVAALVLAFYVGKGFAPEPEIRYHLDIKTVVDVQKVEVEKRVEVVKEVKVRDEVVKWKERVVEVKTPDGTVTITTDRSVDAKTEEKTDISVAKVEDKNKTETVRAETITKEQLLTIPAQPNWRVGGMAGVNFSNVTKDLTALKDSVIYGGTVERRLFGPVWVGGHVNSAGIGAVTLSVEL